MNIERTLKAHLSRVMYFKCCFGTGFPFFIGVCVCWDLMRKCILAIVAIISKRYIIFCVVNITVHHSNY